MLVCCYLVEEVCTFGSGEGGGMGGRGWSGISFRSVASFIADLHMNKV